MSWVHSLTPTVAFYIEMFQPIIYLCTCAPWQLKKISGFLMLSSSCSQILIHFVQVLSLSCLLHQHKPSRWIILFSRVQKVELGSHRRAMLFPSCQRCGRVQTDLSVLWEMSNNLEYEEVREPTCVTLYCTWCHFAASNSPPFLAMLQLLSEVWECCSPWSVTG